MRAPMRPASTSPVPPMARRPLPLVLMRGVCAGAAITVPEPFRTTVHWYRSASACADGMRSFCTWAVLQPSSLAASNGCGVRTVAWGRSPMVARCCKRFCSEVSCATALRPSASSTRWALRCSTWGKTACTALPPPQPQTTCSWSNASCSNWRCITSGGALSLAWPDSRLKMTRPAPACRAAEAARMAAPVMPMPWVAMPSPPITATSPWLPLWLAWCLGLSASGVLSWATGCTRCGLAW